MRKRNPEHPWSDIQKSRGVNDRIALAMEELSDAVKGAKELLSYYKREGFNAHTIRLLESDIQSSIRSLESLDRAYDRNRLANWTFRR